MSDRTDTQTLEQAPPSGVAEIDALGPWFHNLHLPDGRQTAPHHRLGDFPSFKWRAIEPYLPRNLTDVRVLDIGCNAGFYSFELARLGADVLGIDTEQRYLHQARWAAERFDLPGTVRFEQHSVYDFLGSQEQFDMVWFMGVLYHLRYPLLGLDIVCDLAQRLLVVQSLLLPEHDLVLEPETPEDVAYEDRDRLTGETWPRMAFIERSFAGDPTNWWVPNRACLDAMLRSNGLEVMARPDFETSLWRPIEVVGADEAET